MQQGAGSTGGCIWAPCPPCHGSRLICSRSCSEMQLHVRLYLHVTWYTGEAPGRLRSVALASTTPDGKGGGDGGGGYGSDDGDGSTLARTAPGPDANGPVRTAFGSDARRSQCPACVLRGSPRTPPQGVFLKWAVYRHPKSNQTTPYAWVSGSVRTRASPSGPCARPLALHRGGGGL